MRLVIIILLLLVSLSSASLSLESEAIETSYATEEMKRDVIFKFIQIGDFGYPYFKILPISTNVDLMLQCAETEMWLIYHEHGLETQYGLILIGCAYRLGWL